MQLSNNRAEVAISGYLAPSRCWHPNAGSMFITSRSGSAFRSKAAVSRRASRSSRDRTALKAESNGNAIRSPLGVHRKTNRRYWFYEAEPTPEAQLAYLDRLTKLTEAELSNIH